MEFRPGNFVYDAEDIPFGTVWWFIYAGISCLLVLFAGIMSGLTLGLMSLGLVDLEILQQSGSSTEKKQAGTTLPNILNQTSFFSCFSLWPFRSHLQLLFCRLFRSSISCLSPCFFVTPVPWRYSQVRFGNSNPWSNGFAFFVKIIAIWLPCIIGFLLINGRKYVRMVNFFILVVFLKKLYCLIIFIVGHFLRGFNLIVQFNQPTSQPTYQPTNNCLFFQ